MKWEGISNSFYVKISAPFSFYSCFTGPQWYTPYSQASSIINRSILMKHGCILWNPNFSVEVMEQAACKKSKLLCSDLIQPQVWWGTELQQEPLPANKIYAEQK